MNAPSEDIRNMLEAESSLGLVFAENLFLNAEPTNPDDAVTIFDTYGRPQMSLDGSIYEYPSIHIRVRSRDELDAKNLAYDIMNLLNGKHHESHGEALYTVIYCSGSPALLDWDDNGRCKFGVNFSLQRR